MASMVTTDNNDCVFTMTRKRDLECVHQKERMQGKEPCYI